ncbi:unnamed protein product, partial [Mesorhabditis spiculigera]
MRPLTTSALFVIWSSLPNTVMDACARMQDPGVVTTTAVPTTTAIAITTTTILLGLGHTMAAETTTTVGPCNGCPVAPPGQLPPDGAGCIGQADNPAFPWTYANCLSVTDNWTYDIIDGECSGRCGTGVTYLFDGDLIYYSVIKCEGGELLYSIVGTGIDDLGPYNPVPSGYKLFCGSAT